MMHAHEKTTTNNIATHTVQQAQEAVLPERWAREDLWADVAGEEIDEDMSFDFDKFHGLQAEGHQYND